MKSTLQQTINWYKSSLKDNDILKTSHEQIHSHILEKNMHNKFDIHNTTIASLKVIHRNTLEDERGYLERLFCNESLKNFLSGKSIVQINHTLTKKCGVVRGMHFQLSPHSEIKFISCLKGEVFDVTIDLRENSPTFLAIHTEILSANNHKTLMIPEGFAHGFQTLTNDCEMLYFHTNHYHAESERGINALDPLINIQWPLPITLRSERDASHPFLFENYTGITT